MNVEMGLKPLGRYLQVCIVVYTNMYMYMHVVTRMYMYALFLTGSEQQMKQTLKDYLKGDWLFPWDGSEEEEKQEIQ